MSILTDQKGQSPISGIFIALVGMIVLMATLELFNTVVGTIIAGNMSSFSNPDLIRMILGFVGIFIVIGVVYRTVVVPFFGGGPEPGQQGGF